MVALLGSATNPKDDASEATSLEETAIFSKESVSPDVDTLVLSCLSVASLNVDDVLVFFDFVIETYRCETRGDGGVTIGWNVETFQVEGFLPFGRGYESLSITRETNNESYSQFKPLLCSVVFLGFGQPPISVPDICLSLFFDYSRNLVGSNTRDNSIKQGGSFLGITVLEILLRASLDANVPF
jgi:hypothetical protein